MSEETTTRKEVHVNLFLILQELIVGRLVLDLPKEDLKKVNKMIKRNLENA